MRKRLTMCEKDKKTLKHQNFNRSTKTHQLYHVRSQQKPKREARQGKMRRK
jgi:hypothetical protein